MIKKMELSLDNLNKIVEDEINPYLALHQGGMEIKKIDEETNTITISMYGGCPGCPSSQITLYNGIVPILQGYFPELNVELNA